jgi:hypothetical protein
MKVKAHSYSASPRTAVTEPCTTPIWSFPRRRADKDEISL